MTNLINAKDERKVVEFIINQVRANNSHKYLIRMMLILIPYYECFIKSKPCNLVIALLENASISQVLDIQVHCNSLLFLIVYSHTKRMHSDSLPMDL